MTELEKERKERYDRSAKGNFVFTVKNTAPARLRLLYGLMKQKS